MSTAKCLSPMTEEIHTAVGVELAVFVPGDEGYGLLTATPGLQDFPELREFTPDAAPAGPAGVIGPTASCPLSAMMGRNWRWWPSTRAPQSTSG